jgi:hypothetical protein
MLCVIALGMFLEIQSLRLSDMNTLSSKYAAELLQDGVFTIEEAIDPLLIHSLSTELIRCYENKIDRESGAITTENIDSSRRLTFASVAADEFTECGSHTRDLVLQYKSRTQEIGRLVASMLDTLFSPDLVNSVEFGQGPISSIVENSGASSLDHFHVYSAEPSKRGNVTDLNSVPFHIDMGLFLVLSPATWVGPHGSTVDSTDLVVRREDGSSYPVSATEGSVIIIVGSGTTEWLHPESSQRAGVHAVLPISSEKGKRVVLGRMFLPGMDSTSHDVKFSDFFHGPITGPEPQTPTARQWRRLTQVSCAAGKKYCWMNCMPEPDCGGSESVCMDPTTEKECGPSECNTECKLVCPVKPPEELLTTNLPMDVNPSKDGKTDLKININTSAKPPTAKPVFGMVKATEELFCEGATSMVMTGFESVGSDDAQCIILLFRPWLLNTPLKFAIGCIGVFLLGLLIEATIRLRRAVTGSLKFRKEWMKESATIFLFAINVSLGYMAMLAAMTFNVEIFISTVTGLAVGHLIFANSKQTVRETADPCCVTAESANEVQTGLRNSTGACCCEPIRQ